MKTRILLLASVALLSGCASVKTLQISAEGGMAAASIQVDVVPDSAAVQNVPVSQYFLPGNPIRIGANPKTVRFGAGQPSTQDVSVAKMGKRAVVIAQLPGEHSDMSGDADARRKSVQLSGKLPDGTKVTPVMRVGVSQGGISVKPVQ